MTLCALPASCSILNSHTCILFLGFTSKCLCGIVYMQLLLCRLICMACALLWYRQ
jgi:hypothetical protein